MGLRVTRRNGTYTDIDGDWQTLRITRHNGTYFDINRSDTLRTTRRNGTFWDIEQPYEAWMYVAFSGDPADNENGWAFSNASSVRYIRWNDAGTVNLYVWYDRDAF